MTDAIGVCGATAVVVGGDARRPEARSRHQLKVRHSQPYHDADGLELDAAATLIAAAEAAALDEARRQLPAVLAAAPDGVRGVGIQAMTFRLPSTLAATIASHAAKHAAEGEIGRVAIESAAGEAGLEVVRLTESRALDAVTEVTRLGAADVAAHLALMGKPLGAPWRKEHKTAALVAWAVLVLS